jgi:hypothetical protein
MLTVGSFIEKSEKLLITGSTIQCGTFIIPKPSVVKVTLAVQWEKTHVYLATGQGWPMQYVID